MGEEEPRWISLEDTNGTPVQISPSYVPPDAEVTHAEAMACSGRVASAVVRYRIPPASDANERIAAGESFFDVEHGAEFSISRFAMEVPAVRTSAYPAERLQAADIGGRPAVVARPLVAEGFGSSGVFVWNESNGVLTMVLGTDLPLATLISIAEGVSR
jgi:hypothetical protein